MDFEDAKRHKKDDTQATVTISSLQPSIESGAGRHHKPHRSSKTKRLETIRKRRHERIQKIIIKVRGGESKEIDSKRETKHQEAEEEELDKVEKLIVRLYYGRRRLLGHHRRRSTNYDVIRKRKASKLEAQRRKRNIKRINQGKDQSAVMVEKIPVPPVMKKLMVNKTIGETILHRAARQGLEDVVLYCLKTNCISVDVKDNAGYTPMHECCVKGHLKIARHLLRYGADVNASASGGIRPIHDAVQGDHIEMVRLLLSYGADPLLATYSGLTPLKMSRSEKMLDFFKGFLVDITGEPCDGVQPWCFSGPAKCFDPVETGFDIFDELPLDIEEGGEDDIVFEVSDRPHLKTYLLNAPKGTGTDAYCLLKDVLHQTGLTESELLARHFRAHILSVSPLEFRRIEERSQLGSKTSLEECSTVFLVQLDDSIRQLLGIETVVISSQD